MMDLLAVRNEIARVLRSTLADQGSDINSGGGFDAADLWVWIGGVEYLLTIRRTDRKEPQR